MTVFKTSRQLGIPPAAVFAAIRDPVQLAAWWGPEGFTNEFEQFTFEPNGKWVFCMVGPDGARYPNASIFTHIVPDTQVVIQHACAPHFTLTITLVPTPSGTRVDWEQVFADASVAQAVRHIVEPANEQNLDRLAALLGATRAGSAA